MNKAFVREDATEHDDEDHTEPALPAGVGNYMTPAGHARLQDEFAHLVREERPRVVDVVAWAAGNGDRSENGDYLYGKKRLREIDRRIRFLAKRLENAVVVDPASREKTDTVYFGASVSVLDETGARNLYSIVGIDEADPARGRLSWVAPLARALLKARAGDIVRCQTPNGAREFEILEVDYLPLD